MCVCVSIYIVCLYIYIHYIYIYYIILCVLIYVLYIYPIIYTLLMIQNRFKACRQRPCAGGEVSHDGIPAAGILSRQDWCTPVKPG